MLLGSGLANLVLLNLRKLSTHQDRGDAIVHVVHHIVEKLSTLELEDNERVFLLVGSVLNGMLQFVEGTQVFLTIAFPSTRPKLMVVPPMSIPSSILR